MKKKFLIYAIFSVGALMLNSCGGGGGGSAYNPPSSGDNNQPVVENPQPPSDGGLVPNVKPEVYETPEGVIVRGSNGNQTLEVFIPGAVIDRSYNSLSSMALNDIGTAQGIKIPVNGEKFSFSFTDPDPYDNTLFIGVKSQNKNIDFTGAYDNTTATLITGNFDVFDKYFQVNKNNNTNKATLNLNFGNKLYTEGESDTITVGGWDTLNEGVKYNLPVKKDDLADVVLDSNNTNCPYDFDSSNNVIYLPTKDDTGLVYIKTHCIPLKVIPGGDDSTDNDSTTVNIYEGNSTTPNSVLVNNQVLNGNVTGVYNLSNNLSAGQTKDLKVEVKANLGGDTNKVSSKVYNFTLKGDPSDIVIKACLTADLNATSCTPGPNNVPFGNPILDKSYSFIESLDTNNDGVIDYDKYCIVTNGTQENCVLYDGGSKYIIPSTGAKLFVYVDKQNSTAVTGRDYEFKLWKDSGYVKTYPTTDPLNFSKVYTLGNAEDLNNDKIQVVDCSSGKITLLGWDTYRIFNNYKSLFYGPGVKVCKNTPTK